MAKSHIDRASTQVKLGDGGHQNLNQLAADEKPIVDTSFPFGTKRLPPGVAAKIVNAAIEKAAEEETK